MARKKNYKDGELEEEFSLFCYYHKLVTIGFALKLEDESVYKNNRFLKEKYEEVSKSTTDMLEIADAVLDIYIAQHDEGDDSELNEVYEYCWDIVVSKIEDNMNYTQGETKRSLF